MNWTKEAAKPAAKPACKHENITIHFSGEHSIDKSFVKGNVVDPDKFFAEEWVLGAQFDKATCEDCGQELKLDLSELNNQ